MGEAEFDTQRQKALEIALNRALEEGRGSEPVESFSRVFPGHVDELIQSVYQNIATLLLLGRDGKFGQPGKMNKSDASAVAQATHKSLWGSGNFSDMVDLLMKGWRKGEAPIDFIVACLFDQIDHSSEDDINRLTGLVKAIEERHPQLAKGLQKRVDAVNAWKQKEELRQAEEEKLRSTRNPALNAIEECEKALNKLCAKMFSDCVHRVNGKVVKGSSISFEVPDALLGKQVQFRRIDVLHPEYDTLQNSDPRDRRTIIGMELALSGVYEFPSVPTAFSIDIPQHFHGGMRLHKNGSLGSCVMHFGATKEAAKESIPRDNYERAFLEANPDVYMECEDVQALERARAEFENLAANVAFKALEHTIHSIPGDVTPAQIQEYVTMANDITKTVLALTSSE